MKGSRLSIRTFYFKRINKFKIRMKGLMRRSKRLLLYTSSSMKNEKLGHLKERLNR